MIEKTLNIDLNHFYIVGKNNLLEQLPEFFHSVSISEDRQHDLLQSPTTHQQMDRGREGEED